MVTSPSVRRSNLMFIDPANPANPVFTTGGDPNGPVNTVSSNTNNVVYFGGKFSRPAARRPRSSPRRP